MHTNHSTTIVLINGIISTIYIVEEMLVVMKQENLEEITSEEGYGASNDGSGLIYLETMSEVDHKEEEENLRSKKIGERDELCGRKMG